MKNIYIYLIDLNFQPLVEKQEEKKKQMKRKSWKNRGLWKKKIIIFFFTVVRWGWEDRALSGILSQMDW